MKKNRQIVAISEETSPAQFRSGLHFFPLTQTGRLCRAPQSANRATTPPARKAVTAHDDFIHGICAFEPRFTRLNCQSG
jgi:hypothetical protein